MLELVLVSAVLVLGCAIAFAIVVLVTGDDPGLVPVSQDGAPLDLPSDRPLSEADVLATRFDTGLRGYRTSQVDDAFARMAYDVGFKDELIKVLAGEVSALRAGRRDEADSLRDVRRKALGELGDDTGATAAMDPDAEVGSVEEGKTP
ncbi:DivIVA domain-containing protein [Stackebrandtia albiflava]|uniref:DivIVA domain-containing protein n=1 Tax=Stackebrandtia albiflava TaxID=406432 RepID=A0A562UPG0_9ACTN|nr:DivIVA domain-containing protein [Stackebrandtia albiflava]TWJ07509.1 DivIVA domain-containing protein [Stackebrandtia albiflava]